MSEEQTIESFVSGLSDKQLQCRRLGHYWRHHDVHRIEGGFEEILRCPSCLTKRHDTLSATGHVVSRSYNYSDGYQAKNVTGGVMGQRDMFRLEALTRLVSKADAKAPKGRRLRAVS